MYIIKALIAFVCLANVPVVSDDGWVAVAQPEKQSDRFDDIDHSIWVVFSKKIGSEKLLISFPEDPQYHYLEGKEDQLEVVGMDPDARFSLKVVRGVYDDADALLKSRIDSLQAAAIARAEAVEMQDRMSAELVYWQDGHWYQETLISTAGHTYLLQSRSAGLDLAAHAQFSGSFDLESLT